MILFLILTGVLLLVENMEIKSIPLINKGIYLVGETSHSVHPVAGQGLNLCLRDITDLIELVNLDYRETKFMRLVCFNCCRYIDILTTIIITHSLANFFIKDTFFARLIKKISFYMLSKYLIIRKLVLLIMTDGIHFLIKPLLLR